MVPIHDSDLAENRFKDGEWRNLELWEKVEQRLKRKKTWIIVGTVVIFLALSSVPILRDRYPKWVTLKATRQLAIEVNRLKLESSFQQSPVRIRFPDRNSLDYVVERIFDCDAPAFTGRELWTGTLASHSPSDFVMLTEETGKALGLQRLITTFCYDPVRGNPDAVAGQPAGMAIIPVKDLTEHRLDRISVFFVSGTAAETSFD